LSGDRVDLSVWRHHANFEVPVVADVQIARSIYCDANRVIELGVDCRTPVTGTTRGTDPRNSGDDPIRSDAADLVVPGICNVEVPGFAHRQSQRIVEACRRGCKAVAGGTNRSGTAVGRKHSAGRDLANAIVA